LTDSLRRKIIIGCAIFFTLGYLLDVYSQGFRYGSLQYASLIGCILFVIAALYYFIELLKKSDIDDIKQQPFVWICVGYLIYGIGFPVIFFARNLQLESTGMSMSDEFIKGLQNVLGIIVIAMYTIISSAFVWTKNHSTSNELE
jgi:hypothetical protein